MGNDPQLELKSTLRGKDLRLSCNLPPNAANIVQSQHCSFGPGVLQHRGQRVEDRGLPGAVRADQEREAVAKIQLQIGDRSEVLDLDAGDPDALARAQLHRTHSHKISTAPDRTILSGLPVDGAREGN